jgi:hypothetical protein
MRGSMSCACHSEKVVSIRWMKIPAYPPRALRLQFWLERARDEYGFDLNRPMTLEVDTDGWVLTQEGKP